MRPTPSFRAQEPGKRTTPVAVAARAGVRAAAATTSDTYVKRCSVVSEAEDVDKINCASHDADEPINQHRPGKNDRLSVADTVDDESLTSKRMRLRDKGSDSVVTSACVDPFSV